jgi:hypothetical protein
MRATKRSNDNAFKRDTDYHVLGENLFADMPREKIRMCADFIKETIKQSKKSETIQLSHADIRRCYIDGATLI